MNTDDLDVTVGGGEETLPPLDPLSALELLIGRLDASLEEAKALVAIIRDSIHDPDGPPVEPPVDPEEPPVDPEEPPIEVEPPVDPEPPVEPEEPEAPHPPITVEPIPETPIPVGGIRVRVKNGEELTKLLAKGGILPGTTLVLSHLATFDGKYAIKNQGTKERPIRLVGEKHDEGIQTKVPGQFVIQPDYVQLWGFDFTQNERKVELWGRGDRVTKCRFTGISYDGMIYLVGDSHPEIMVDRCEFLNFSGAAIRCELRNAEKSQNMSFHRNLFKGHKTRSDNESVILVLTDAFSIGGIRYHRNLFKSCLQNNTTGQGEIISVKTGAAGVTENTIEDTQGYISLRETSRCRVVLNWMDAKSHIKVFGDDHVLVSNRGEGLAIELNRGDAYASDPLPPACRNYMKAGRTTIIVKGGQCRPAHCGVRRAVVEHTVGRIQIGSKNDERYGYNKPASQLVLRYNDRVAIRIGDDFGPIKESDIGKTNNTARRLTEADVGIKA